MPSPNTLKLQGPKFVLKDHGTFTAVNKKDKKSKYAGDKLINDERIARKEICREQGITMKQFRKAEKKARRAVGENV